MPGKVGSEITAANTVEHKVWTAAVKFGRHCPNKTNRALDRIVATSKATSLH